jgi:hypothetical protein
MSYHQTKQLSHLMGELGDQRRLKTWNQETREATCGWLETVSETQVSSTGLVLTVASPLHCLKYLPIQKDLNPPSFDRHNLKIFCSIDLLSNCRRFPATGANDDS